LTVADVLENLAEWMTPYTITMNAETLAQRRALVEGLADAAELEPHGLIEAAHGRPTPQFSDLFVEASRRVDASTVVTGDDGFAAALAAVVAIIRLDRSDDAVLLALLTSSADFLDLDPAIPQLRTNAADAVDREALKVRTRLEPADTPKEVRTLLAAASTALADAADLDHVIQAAGARDKALTSVARRVENLAVAMERRLGLLEEELDLLWWSRTGRSRTDAKPWEEIPAARRAALAGIEVASLFVARPAPRSARSLLRTALAGDVDTKFTIGAVGVEMPQRGSQAPRLALLPLTTYRTIVDTVGTDSKVLGAAIKTMAPDLHPDSKTALIDLAEQALRELQIVALL
jgi:hypothetical protein